MSHNFKVDTIVKDMMAVNLKLYPIDFTFTFIHWKT